MSELLSRAGALFVAPAQSAPRMVMPPTPAGFVGVLAAPDVLVATTGGVAATLRRPHRARTALVLLPETLAAAGPALPAARAAARRLTDRGLCAAAAGTTVRVGLPQDAEAGAREAWRAISAAGDAPVVIGLCERSDGYDAVLAQAGELMLAATGDDDLAALVLASLATLGPPTAGITPPRGFAARRLAALGLTRIQAQPTKALA